MLVTAVAAVTALAAPQGQGNAGAALSPGKSHKKVCAKPKPKHVECHAEVITQADGVTPDASTSRPPGSLGPADLKSAYALPGTTGAGKTIAIVDAYDNPNAESDLGAYRSAVGLPACTTANGCFRKVNQRGVLGQYPSPDTGWAGEIDLDLQAASATCPACKLLLVEADDSFSDNLAAAVDTAASLGANAISNSYGANEASDIPSYESDYNHPGIAVTASSGDDGYDGNTPSYPASSRYVTGVGGTHLVRDSSARGWTESVWFNHPGSGGAAGSGCSTYISKPSWQKDTGCSNKTVADVSAVADPNTGFGVYDSYGSFAGQNWYVYGGTSLASPIVAAIFAMGGASDPSYPYAHKTSLNDVVSGSNGSCGTYVCNAATGYDGPTGLGTPNGLGAFGAAATTTTTTTRPTTTTTRPTTTTTTAPTTTTTGPTPTTTPGQTPAPTGVAANAVSTTQIDLSWNSVPGATVYQVLRSTTSGSGYSVIGSPSGTSFKNGGLNPGTQYFYVVRAYSPSGHMSPNSSEVNATTKIQTAAPTGVVAHAVSSTQINLSWNAVAGATGYQVFRSETSGSGYAQVGSPSGAAFANIGLSPGHTYYYVVKAYSPSGGLSPFSNPEASATTPTS